MVRATYILTVLAAVLCAAVAASALERFPPPEFETDYERPTTTTPHPRQDVWEYVDTGVLIVTLALAACVVLRWRNRKAIFAVMVFSLVYFGFFRQGCVCPIGAIQNVTLTGFDAEYVVPIAVLVFFAAPLVFTLFFGRAFCGSVCPLGAIQDVVLIRPVKVPGWLESGLRLFAYTYLGAAVLFAATGSAFIICRYDPFVGFFRLSGNWNILVFGAALLLVGLFVGRPYCRFLCPYGIILRHFSRLSRWRVSITPTECVKCRLCEDACPFGAIRPPTSDWPAREYQVGRWRLAFLLLLLPVLVAVGAWGGYKLHAQLARAHWRVRVAERVNQEETGQVEGTTDASDAFRATGVAPDVLYAEATQIRRGFAIGGPLLGGFIGLAVSGTLLSLSVKRRREDYEADPAGCLACGRCYQYCPKEHERLKQKKEAAVRH